MAWPSLSLVEEDRELRAVASISFPPPVVVTATLAFPSGIGRLCSGRYRAEEEKKRHSIHTSRHSASSYASFVPSFALFRVVSPLFFNAPLPLTRLKAARKRYPLLSLFFVFFRLPLSLSLSETPLSNPRFSARVFPSLRERTRVWLITWSSDICADRKLRTSPFVYMREREEVLSSFRPVPPFSFNPWRYDADVLFQSRVLSG